MANSESPEFRAFSRAKNNLVRQLSFSLTFLKSECLSSEPQLLTFDEDQERFGGHGSTPAQDTSKLLDIVLARIRLDPSFYKAFRGLQTLGSGANKPLARLMDSLLEEEKKKVVPKKKPVAVANRRIHSPPGVYNPPTSMTGGRHSTCSLEEYLRSISGGGVDEALNQQVTDIDAAYISQCISDWQELIPFFGLSEVDRRTILDNNPHSVQVQRRDLLILWRSGRGRRHATYRTLAGCFYKAGKRVLVEKVVEVLGYEVPSWPVDPQEESMAAVPENQPNPSVVRVYPSEPPKIKDLMKLLYNEVPHEWDGIGTFLEIGVPQLESIRQANLNNPQKCLLAMLNLWLNRPDPPPSWEAIAEAVEVVGRGDIAQKMANPPPR